MKHDYLYYPNNNMNHKLLLFSILACGVVFLVGCGSMGGNARVAPQYNPRTGTEGIVFSFMKDAPPQQAYGGTTIPIALSLENKGSFDVEEAYVVWQIPKGLFTFEEAVDTFELYGKTVHNPQGEIKQLYQYVTAKKLPPQQETQTTMIGATLCYQYETVLSEEICVDSESRKNVAAANKNKAPCQVNDISSSGQGAPLAITKVEVSMLPTKDETINPRFTIHVKNKGSGIVLNKDELQVACSPDARPYLYNIVYLEEARLSKIYNLDCTGLQRSGNLGRSYVVLDDQQESVFVCDYKQGIPLEKGIFSTPLLIKLGYGYTETKSKQVEIRSSSLP